MLRWGETRRMDAVSYLTGWLQGSTRRVLTATLCLLAWSQTSFSSKSNGDEKEEEEEEEEDRGGLLCCVRRCSVGPCIDGKQCVRRLVSESRSMVRLLYADRCRYPGVAWVVGRDVLLGRAFLWWQQRRWGRRE